MEAAMYQRILVPLDGSEHAESVLPLVCKLASMKDAEITLLRVVEYPLEAFPSSEYFGFNSHPFPEPGLDEQNRAMKANIQRQVKTYLERLAASFETCTRKVMIEIQEGPVVDAILNSVEKLDIDLIVMSTTGEGQCSWGLGSIANRILREAQVPVSLLGKGPGPSVFDHTKRQNYTQPVYLESQHEYSR
jgi:nucleotide-binding universal stress UspA family protein